MEEDASAPTLELIRNHGRTEPYEVEDGCAHVAPVGDDFDGTVARLKEQGVKMVLEPKTMTVEVRSSKGSPKTVETVARTWLPSARPRAATRAKPSSTSSTDRLGLAWQ